MANNKLKAIPLRIKLPKPKMRRPYLQISGLVFVLLFTVAKGSWAQEPPTKGVPVPPPDLVLQQNMNMPKTASYLISGVYGAFLGTYLGSLSAPLHLGLNHRQPGAAMLSSVLGLGLGSGLGLGYAAITKARLQAAQAFTHYTTLGVLSGIGIGNFFGNRGNPVGAEYTSGLAGALGGTLLALSMESAGQTNHGSMLLGAYSSVLAGAGALALGTGVGFNGEAMAGLTFLSMGLSGTFVSMAAAPLNPNSIQAGTIFLSGVFFAGTAAATVGFVDILAGNERLFLPGMSSGTAQAWAGLAGAVCGALVGDLIYEWGAIRWLQKGPRALKSGLAPPEPTLFAIQSLRSGTGSAQPVMGVRWRIP